MIYQDFLFLTVLGHNTPNRRALRRFLVKCEQADVRLPRKRNSTSLDARPVYLIITMMKWSLTSRLSIKNSFLLRVQAGIAAVSGEVRASQARALDYCPDYHRAGPGLALNTPPLSLQLPCHTRALRVLATSQLHKSRRALDYCPDYHRAGPGPSARIQGVG